jgi:hypothetical protein
MRPHEVGPAQARTCRLPVPNLSGLLSCWLLAEAELAPWPGQPQEQFFDLGVPCSRVHGCSVEALVLTVN